MPSRKQSIQRIFVFSVILSMLLPLGCDCGDDDDASDSTNSDDNTDDDVDDDTADGDLNDDVNDDINDDCINDDLDDDLDDDLNDDLDDDTTQSCDECLSVILPQIQGSSNKGISLAGPEVAWAEGPYGVSIVFFQKGGQITQVTDGLGFDDTVQTDGSRVYWVREGGWKYPNESEIWYWDGSDSYQLTDNELFETELALDAAGNLYWSERDTPDLNTYEMYFYDGGQIEKLTDNTVYDARPAVQEGMAAWVSGDINDRNNLEIQLYDGEVHPITDDNLYDDNPVISQGRLAWEVRDVGDILRCDIALYDDGITTILTDNQGSYIEPTISYPYVAWTSCAIGDASYESCEIQLYHIETQEFLTITENDVVDERPVVADGVVMWGSRESNEAWENAEILLYSIADGSAYAVTADMTADYPWQLQIRNGYVAWACDGGQGQEIVIGEMDCLKNCAN